MFVSTAYGGVIVFAFSLGEIAARLRGESLIQRLGEMCIGSNAMILGGVVLLPVVLSQNPTLIVVVFLFFGFISANFYPIRCVMLLKLTFKRLGSTLQMSTPCQ